LSFCTKTQNNSKTVVPIAPTKLTATTLSSDKVKLLWSDNSSNETGFIIERKDNGSIFSIIANVNVDLVSYVDSLLLPNKTYTYRIYAYNSSGNSSFSNEVEYSTPLNVGDNFQRGKVAYILQPSDPGYDSSVKHGIITTANDISNGAVWDNGVRMVTGASGVSIGSGKTNTNLIVAAHGNGSYAAQLCSNLISGSYSDWYLPSKDELSKLFDNRFLIGGFSSGDKYWSSSEVNYYTAWQQDFGSGVQDFVSSKFSLRCIRPIRYF
jgi:hypothetical protein